MRPPRLFTLGLLLAALLAVWHSARGQEAAHPLQNAFASCVYGVANRHFPQLPRAGADELAEIGFTYCQTEERALAAYARDGGLTSREIERVIVDTRTRIKNTLRDVMNNPSKYAPRR